MQDFQCSHQYWILHRFKQVKSIAKYQPILFLRSWYSSHWSHHWFRHSPRSPSRTWTLVLTSISRSALRLLRWDMGGGWGAANRDKHCTGECSRQGDTNGGASLYHGSRVNSDWFQWYPNFNQGTTYTSTEYMSSISDALTPILTLLLGHMVVCECLMIKFFASIYCAFFHSMLHKHSPKKYDWGWHTNWFYINSYHSSHVFCKAQCMENWRKLAPS